MLEDSCVGQGMGVGSWPQGECDWVVMAASWVVRKWLGNKRSLVLGPTFWPILLSQVVSSKKMKTCGQSTGHTHRLTQIVIRKGGCTSFFGFCFFFFPSVVWACAGDLNRVYDSCRWSYPTLKIQLEFHPRSWRSYITQIGLSFLWTVQHQSIWNLTMFCIILFMSIMFSVLPTR
jgi:hypothetical protein